MSLFVPQVRFAFWSAEELGLLGSYHYVMNLNPQDKNNTALNLNYDMLVCIRVYVVLHLFV